MSASPGLDTGYPSSCTTRKDVFQTTRKWHKADSEIHSHDAAEEPTFRRQSAVISNVAECANRANKIVPQLLLHRTLGRDPQHALDHVESSTLGEGTDSHADTQLCTGADKTFDVTAYALESQVSSV